MPLWERTDISSVRWFGEGGLTRLIRLGLSLAEDGGRELTGKHMTLMT